MNDLKLTESFRDYAALLPQFDGWLLHIGQSDEDFVFPDETKAVAIIFESKSEPLAGSGSFARSTFTITVESHSQDGSAALHGQRVDLVRSAFFGTADSERATKATVIATINAVGAIRILGYSSEANETGIDSSRFKTTMVIAVGYSS